MSSDITLLHQVLHGLQKSSYKSIPFSLLYDSKGSQLYEQIVDLDEYYPYRAESQLFELHSPGIANTVPPDCYIVELGCGTALKTAYILNALLALHGRCQYVGIDVSESFLKQAHRNLLDNVQGLRPDSLHFVEGDYLQGLRKARQMFPTKLLCVTWLGSSVGNLAADDAVSFMREVLTIVGPRCLFFLCTDQWKDTSVLYRAYCDELGVTEKFIKNGMKNALALLGHVVKESEEAAWSYHVQINSKLRRVEMWITFPEGLSIKEHQVNIRPGESVLVEFSRKFTIQDVQELATKSGFYIQEAWRNQLYGSQMLYSCLEALLRCWADTDSLFDGILDWTVKPIDLRHPFLFYYGHVHAFAKLKLFDADKASAMDLMFSRGIDPSVLDPSKCHNHPEPPLEWPSHESLCVYAREVRSMVEIAIKAGSIPTRLVCFVLEHERMHQETLAYMVTQQVKAEFEKGSHGLNKSQNGDMKGLRHASNDVIGGERNIPNVLISPGKITMGAQPSESTFVWDNELPLVETFVMEPFMVSSWPVSVKEYMSFIVDGGYTLEDVWEKEDYDHFNQKGYRWPATWSFVDGHFYVHGHSHKTTKHWTEVAHEAVFVSLAEAQAYCKWAGEFRIMKEEEYHKALVEDGKMVHALRDGGWEWTCSPFQGFPGFEAMAEYEEYSADFFDGTHFVLKGSSPVTHPALIRDSFRNFYQRQYRYVFAKFRCCKSMPNGSLARADSNGSNSHYRSAVFGYI